MIDALSISNSRSEIREFLELSCLYLSLADHQLTTLEQEWLDFQFGKGTAERFIAGFSGLDWDSVFGRINELIGLMTSKERGFIAAHTKDFLIELLSVDGIEFEEDQRLREYLAYISRLGIHVQELSPEEEVKAYKERVARLYSVHRGEIQQWDWKRLATALPPPYPVQFSTHRLQASQVERLNKSAGISVPEYLHQQATAADQADYHRRLEEHDSWYGEFQETQSMARAINRGELTAYGDVLQRLGPFGAIQDIGTSVEFELHSPKIVEVQISVHRKDVIPDYEKHLAKSGAVRVKKMTRKIYHELYQDYVCGCVIRVARELFALLPLEYILITAESELEGGEEEKPILSVILPRTLMTTVDFDSVDPSDCVDELTHRGDFRASRAQNAFKPVVPLTVADIPSINSSDLTVDRLCENIRKMRTYIADRRLSWEVKRK